MEKNNTRENTYTHREREREVGGRVLDLSRATWSERAHRAPRGVGGRGGTRAAETERGASDERARPQQKNKNR
jgi:hypothetical protein